jgi:hypothetical protein
MFLGTVYAPLKDGVTALRKNIAPPANRVAVADLREQPDSLSATASLRAFHATVEHKVILDPNAPAPRHEQA